MIANVSFIGVENCDEQVQRVNNQPYNYWENNLPTHYHLGFRNHKNFSFGNLRNVLPSPPGFDNKVAKKKPSLENILSTFIVETRERFNKDEERLHSIETHCSNMGSTIKSLEVQRGRIFHQCSTKGKILSDTEKNPKELCKAITLRSGNEVESPKVQEE